MPKHKDFKRRARARMQKTGESYTTARQRLLEQRERRSPSKEISAAVAVMAPDPATLSRLAGIADAAIRTRTGRDWKGWVEALDALGARAMPHGDISALVSRTFEVGSWWAQAVTVGYERIHGLRAIGQRRGGHYEASKTKTVRAPIEALYRACADARQRGSWLKGVKPAVRSARKGKAIRLDWEDGTVAELNFIAKTSDRSLVNVTHRKLPDNAARERMKVFWGERLEALAAQLGRSSA